MEQIRLEPTHLENTLARLSKPQLDELPFGAILVDGEGIIHFYCLTDWESTARDPAEIIGRNFCRDIWPGACAEEICVRFREGVQSGELNVLFEYSLDHEMPPIQVQIHMKNHRHEPDRYWILIKRL